MNEPVMANNPDPFSYMFGWADGATSVENRPPAKQDHPTPVYDEGYYAGQAAQEELRLYTLKRWPPA